MMDLDQFLKESEWTEVELAREVGTSQPTINRIRHGAATASLSMALRVEWATKGVVKAITLPVSPNSRFCIEELAKGRKVYSA